LTCLKRGRYGALAAAAVILAACGGNSPGNSSDASREVTVFAAASLTEAFGEIARAFEDSHPGMSVRFNFAGSQQLAASLVEGAPGDVFASADERHMEAVADADLLAAPPEVFATNRLTIAVERGNPLGIGGLEDLEDPAVAVVLAAEEVPAGQYARAALMNAGVEVSPVSLEEDVRAVLSRVSLGEADAGIVYATDVAAADGRVEGVMIPSEVNVSARYPIAVLRDARNAEIAEAFVVAALGSVGQRILGELGFAPP